MRLCVKPGLAAILLTVVIFANAQDSQFHFDPNGNLFVQTAATTSAPEILGQPQNRILAPGDSASFPVVAVDTRLLAYQWRFNGTNIFSATNDAVLLQNVSTNSEGEYRVVLTNPSGSVTSAPAMLWIDSDADGVADSWERTFFTNLSQTATADFDSDGVSNDQEFRDGTNPTNSAAALFRLTVLRDGGSVAIVPDQSTYTNGQIVTLTATASGSETFRAWLGDIVTRTNPITLVMTNNKTVSARFTPVVFTWTNFAGGDWSSATNWTPNLVPGSNDSVVISGLALAGPGTFTVTLNTPADCASVTLDTGLQRTPTLTGSGTLTVRESLLWRGGTMSGSGRTVIESGAVLMLDTANTFGNGPTLNTRTLELGGETFWTTAGNLTLNNAVVTNRPGAGFHAFGAGTIQQSGGTSQFDNTGTFRKSASTGTTTVGSGLNFNNWGQVEIEAGTLLCNGGFTNQGAVNVAAGATIRLEGGGSATGTFSSLVGALVEWTGGTFTLIPGAQLNGAGLYRISRAVNNVTVSAEGNLNVENLDLVSHFFSTGSTLGGTGTVSIANAMNWTAGTMSGSGRTVIDSGATLTLQTGTGLTLSRTLELGGETHWTTAGSLTLNNAIMTNRAGAVFHAAGAGTIQQFGGTSGFDNAGTYRKLDHPGTNSIGSGLNFNNWGLVEIETGTLLCSGGFTNHGDVSLSAGATNRLEGGGSATGTFNTPPDALVEWTGGTFTLNPGAQLNGAGSYRINRAVSEITVNVEGNLDVENLDLASSFFTTGSTLGGTGTVTIATLMNWTVGAMSGSGRTVIAPGATLQIANPSGVTLARSLENAGTVLWTGVGNFFLNSGVITNCAGALFHAQNAASLSFGGGVPRFDNAGTFRKSVNAGLTTVVSGVNFTNYGTVDLRSGILAANGGYVSSADALLNCALGGTSPGTNYGQLQVAGTVTLNGALSVDLLPGFSPATNDTFTVLIAGNRSGTFNNFLYPSNAVTMQLSNTANSVIVHVTDVFTTIPQPVLLSPELIGTDIRLTWTAVSNAAYRLEFNPDLSPSNWIALPGEVLGTSNTASKLDPLTQSNRLYRVRVLP